MTLSKSDTIAIIRSLLSSTNDSYSIFNLNRDFKNETGIDIPLFGYGNISDFLNSIPETVKVTGVYPIQRISLVSNEKSAHVVSLVKRQRKNEPKKRFLPKRKPLTRKDIDFSFRTEEIRESRIVLEEEEEEEAPDDMKDRISPSFGHSSVPMRNFLKSNRSIPIIDVKVHTRIGEYVEVCPCWIYTPDKFYFRFRKFKRKFHNFTKKLQLFYEEADQQIPCLTDNVEPKQPCAVFHKISSTPMWHRAEIQEISNSSQVTVNFVDYGNSAEVLKENVKYLDQSFHSFPRQAILGCLANIKPLNNRSKWSCRSIIKFHDLAFEKDLIGGVVYINDDGCMGMALSCTGDSEIHINDALVKEGYAEFAINVSKSNFEEVRDKESVHKAVLQPKFTENTQSSVYFFNSDDFNNMKLRKMFSV